MCYNPLLCVRTEILDSFTGELNYNYKLFFGENAEKYKLNYLSNLLPGLNPLEMFLPCGKCASCLAQNSMMWSRRIMNEASLYKDNCFITLTYKDNPVSLVKRDYQLFLKRLRKKLYPLKIRYFLSGEYGSKRKRPHFHIIIFNWKPDDLVFKFKSGRNDIFTSDSLSSIWSLGLVSIGDLTADSAKYTAKYMQKFGWSDSNLVAPFIRMSTNPGIGCNYLLKNIDSVRNSDRIFASGKSYAVPRYYRKLLLRNPVQKDFDNLNRRVSVASNIVFDSKILKQKNCIAIAKLIER